MNFNSLEYLISGTEKQQAAYALLISQRIFEKLKNYHPVLTGTIPLNIDIEGSDLDVICQWTNKSEFIKTLETLFGHEADFRWWERSNPDAVVASFKVNDFELEIFGQNIETSKQMAFRHMIIEKQILDHFGEEFRLKIISLKKAGVKTEPAFAKLLGLPGDPYIELLKFSI